MRKVGRKEALTKDQLLDAMRKHQTRSPTELASKMKVSRMTVYRRLEKIPEEEINQIFKDLSERDLKPSQTEFSVFEKIPIVEEFNNRLVRKLRVSPRYARTKIRSLWHICVIMKRHPRHLDPEECSDFVDRVRAKEIIIETKRGKEPMGLESTKKTLRSFFQNMMNISGKYLKSLGIDADARPVDVERARARLTVEQRRAFMDVVNEMVQGNWKGKSGTAVLRIRFGDEPHLALRMKVLIKAFYYWGNRKMAILNSRIEDMTWGKMFAVQKIIDKGSHKKGRKVWLKRTTQELLKDMTELYEAIGKVKEGKWFTFQPDAVTEFFKDCYEKAGIPEKLYEGMPIHLWRHTACQDCLDATNRNYELCANILGWESIDTMKKHYGKASEQDIRSGLLQAMGLKVERKKSEFKF